MDGDLSTPDPALEAFGECKEIIAKIDNPLIRTTDEGVLVLKERTSLSFRNFLSNNLPKS